jgi:dienelactone hydrolase
VFAAPALPAEPAPLLVFLGSGQEAFAQAAAARGWEFAALPETLPGDAAVRQIEAAVAQAASHRAIDAARTYLAGRGASAAAVFYTVSRRPDLWAAAVAAGGSVDPAIETNRLFGANAQLVPILWAVPTGDQAKAETTRARMAAKGFDIEVTVRQIGIPDALDWLGAHKSDPYPASVDCETGSAAFLRCYWLQIAKFDPAARNDVLPQSRVAPGPGAYLVLGGFGYTLDDPGPGVLVSFLPPKYVGPLKLNDRIVSVGGTQIKDARGYVAFMAGQTEERALGVVVSRGKDRLRLESRIAMAKREENVTARVRAAFSMDGHQLLLITRGVAAVRFDLPSYWTPCAIDWNGAEAGSAETAGCWSLSQGGVAEKCNQENLPGSGAPPPK